MKIRPDKLFMLTYPDELASENLKAKFKQGGTRVSSADKEESFSGIA